jgi:TonB family protein
MREDAMARMLGLGLGLFVLTAGAPAALAEYIPPKVDHSCPTPPPVIGQAAAVNKEHGEVTLGVFVTSRGHPRKIRVTHSSSYADLDNAAVAAAASWHYVPAVRNGGNISDWMGLKIAFGPRETGRTVSVATTDEATPAAAVLDGACSR